MTAPDPTPFAESFARAHGHDGDPHIGADDMGELIAAALDRSTVDVTATHHGDGRLTVTHWGEDEDGDTILTFTPDTNGDQP